MTQTLGHSQDAMRILAIDIETRPNLAYVWGLWDQNISLNHLVEHMQMICWVAKWIGEPEVEFRSLHHDGQEVMIRRAWELLDEADVVLHYNGKRFDVPHLNREFLRYDLTPPSPYKQIDLLTCAKREFKFPSNKLAYVSQALGLEGKVQHDGFDMWLKCMAGDAEAWDQMEEYNTRDVTLLEELYMKLRPWIRSHPSYGPMLAADLEGEDYGEGDACPSCGSYHLKPQGYAYTNSGRFQRYKCGECGRWSRSSKRCAKTNIVQVPIS